MRRTRWMRLFLLAMTAVMTAGVGVGCSGAGFDSNLPNSQAADDGSKPHDLVPAKTPAGCAVKERPLCKKPQMEVTAQSYAAMIDAFYTETLAGPTSQTTPQFLWIPSGSWVRNACKVSKEHPQKVEGRFLYYCSTAKRVYVGQGSTLGTYDEYGYQVPLVTLGHEAAHWEQDAVGAALDEHQADCFAGALIGWLRSNKRIDPSVDVIGQTIKMFGDIAKQAGDDKAHGGLDERRRWLNDGLTKGPKFCNESFGSKFKLKS